MINVKPEKFFAWLQQTEEEIAGKPASWITVQNSKVSSGGILFLAAVVGLIALLDARNLAIGQDTGFFSTYIYAFAISFATAFIWWVIMNVVVKGTFLRTPASASLGIISAWIILTVTRKIFGFVFLEAEWDVVWANRVLILVGQYMTEGMTQDYRPNENWRLWPSLYLITIIVAAAYGTSGDRPRKFLVPFTLVSMILAAIAWNPNHINYDGASAALKLFGATVCAYLAFGLTYFYYQRAEEYQVNRLRFWLASSAITTFFLTLFLMNPPKFLVEAGYMEQGVKPTQWGGLFVNLVLATAGCVLGFGIGVFLAFGRKSDLPFFKWPSVAIIEIVRSGPLIGWLFIAKYLFKDVIIPIYEPDEIVRMLIMFSLFGGCYIAEVLRGGLQAVPQGQIEAATALGLTPVQTKLFVELPNAVRTTLPSIVGVFIGLWKDTTLVFIVGILDLFKLSKDLPNTDLRFMGDFLEPLYMAAVVFWALSFYMSRVSRGFEANLGLSQENGGEKA